MSNILTDHVALPLASDTFDGGLDHKWDADAYECPRCIAERAVFRALEGRAMDRAASSERVARVLVEDGAYGVPWEDASDDDRAEAVDKARTLLSVALEGK